MYLYVSVACKILWFRINFVTVIIFVHNSLMTTGMKTLRFHYHSNYVYQYKCYHISMLNGITVDL